MELESTTFHAPELYGDSWLNGEPVSIRDLRGRVALIDFWDYTSNHCIRSVPYLSDWAAKYRDFELVVIGVHTPEFKFGKTAGVVQRALERLGIQYPVILDNEALLWNAFGARTWPTKYLVDKDGFIRFTQQGEGNYQQFERALQQLIVQSGYRGRLPDLTGHIRDTDSPSTIRYRSTGDIFLGYLKAALGNNDGYNPESTIDYVDPNIYMPERFYAKGKWLSTRECFTFNGSAGETGSVIVQCDATEVNAVMNSASTPLSEIIVEQDGHSIAKECWGGDIVKGNDGASLVLVDSPKMYNLIRNREFGSHKVTLTTSTPGAEIYTLSFTTSAIPELLQTN